MNLHELQGLTKAASLWTGRPLARQPSSKDAHACWFQSYHVSAQPRRQAADFAVDPQKPRRLGARVAQGRRERHSQQIDRAADGARHIERASCEDAILADAGGTAHTDRAAI